MSKGKNYSKMIREINKLNVPIGKVDFLIERKVEN